MHNIIIILKCNEVIAFFRLSERICGFNREELLIKSQTIHWLIKRQSCHHIETSQLVCRADQLTGFFMMATSTFSNSSKFQIFFL